MDETTLLVYYYISKYIKLLGYAPTYAEIAAYGPFSSKSTEKKHVKKLLNGSRCQAVQGWDEYLRRKVWLHKSCDRRYD